MCVIALAVDKKPTYEQIKKMFDDNSHGCSISWFNEKGLAQYVKGLDEDELFKLVYKTPLPFALHFRQSSFWKDKENKLLNHPFEVSLDSPLRLEGEAEKLLIHNGTIKEYELMLAVADIAIGKDEPITDTRAIAMIMAKNNERLPWRLSGKYVIVDSVRKKFRVVGDFTNENGILFSNLSWKWGHNYQNGLTGISDEDYYAYLMGNEVDFNKGSDTTNSETSETQKKKIAPKCEKNVKKETQKIKTNGKKTAGDIKPELNKTISEYQYNAGILYGESNKSPTTRIGMKERRKWWTFYYNPNLYFQQKDIDKLNSATEFQCKHCKGFLSFSRVNILRISSNINSSEFTCLTCDRLMKNGQSRKETKFVNGINIDPKTTRLLQFGCGC